MWPHGLQPARLPRPWDSPGKNTGVGCHFLLQCMKVKSESEVPQSCPILSDPVDCSPPGSSVHGILQARILEWVAMPCSNLNNWPSLHSLISFPHYSSSWSCFMYFLWSTSIHLIIIFMKARDSLYYSPECLDQALIHLNVCLKHIWPKVFVGWISKWILEWIFFFKSQYT